MPRVWPVSDRDGTPLGWVFDCPGCGVAHRVPPTWTSNGNPDRPTFRPSLLVTGPSPAARAWRPGDPEPAEADRLSVCHSYVTDGCVEFLPDCTHALAGRTVPLPEAD